MSGQYFSMIKTSFRWCLVPIASATASLLSYAVAIVYCGLQNGIFEFYNGSQVTSLTSLILLLACNCLSGYAFVKAGVFTAPKCKRVTAIVLATLFTMLCVCAVVYYVFTKAALLDIISVVASAVASIVAAKSSCIEGGSSSL